MALSKNKLKELFQSEKKPSGDDFANLIDSFLHVTSEILTASRSTANEDEAKKGVVTDKYMTPYLVLKAIESLTKLDTLPGLSNEVQAKIDTAINGLVAGAPSVLNTLNELAEALNDDSNAFNSLRELIDQKEPLIENKNSGFNLNKSDAYNVNDANLLPTSKAIYDLYELMGDYIGKPLFSKKNASTNRASGGIRFGRFVFDLRSADYHVVVKIHPNQDHINYADVSVVFQNKRRDNLDVYITNKRGAHYPETRFDIIILKQEEVGAAKSDNYYEDSSYCFASSKAVNNLRNNLQEKIDGKAAGNHTHNDLQNQINSKAASNHTHPLRVLKVGDVAVQVNPDELVSYSRVTHNNRSGGYVVCVTANGGNGSVVKVYVSNKSANAFDIIVKSEHRLNVSVFYAMISTV